MLCGLSQIGGEEYDRNDNLTKLSDMFKTFIAGILLGIAVAAAGLCEAVRPMEHGVGFSSVQDVYRLNGRHCPGLK